MSDKVPKCCFHHISIRTVHQCERQLFSFRSSLHYAVSKSQYKLGLTYRQLWPCPRLLTSQSNKAQDTTESYSLQTPESIIPESKTPASRYPKLCSTQGRMASSRSANKNVILLFFPPSSSTFYWHQLTSFSPHFLYFLPSSCILYWHHVASFCPNISSSHLHPPLHFPTFFSCLLTLSTLFFNPFLTLWLPLTYASRCFFDV